MCHISPWFAEEPRANTNRRMNGRSVYEMGMLISQRQAWSDMSGLFLVYL